jgi:hypothetical protein
MAIEIFGFIFFPLKAIIFKSQLSTYLILAFSNFALIIFLTILSKLVAQLELFGGKWTIYPALSDNMYKQFGSILNGIQVLLLLSFFLIGYRMGKYKRFINKKEQNK